MFGACTSSGVAIVYRGADGKLAFVSEARRLWLSGRRLLSCALAWRWLGALALVVWVGRQTVMALMCTGCTIVEDGWALADIHRHSVVALVLRASVAYSKGCPPARLSR